LFGLGADTSLLKKDIAQGVKEGAAAADVEKDAGSAGSRAGKSYAKGFATAAKVGVAGAVAIAAASVDAAVKFQSTMTRIQTQAGASGAAVKQLTAQVLKLAPSTQQGPEQLAEALYHLKSVGMDNVDAMKALKTASDLAAVGGALVLMTDEGVPAVDAATRLKMSFSLLGAPSQQASRYLKEIGLTGLQLANTMRSSGGLVATISLLKTKLDESGMSASQQAILLSHAFGGGRSSSAILTMINNLSTLKQKQDQINTGVGKYGDDVAKQRQTVQAQLDLLKSSFETLGIQIGNALLPPLTKFVQFLAQHVTQAVSTVTGIIGKLAKSLGLGASGNRPKPPKVSLPRCGTRNQREYGAGEPLSVAAGRQAGETWRAEPVAAEHDRAGELARRPRHARCPASHRGQPDPGRPERPEVQPGPVQEPRHRAGQEDRPADRELDRRRHGPGRREDRRRDHHHAR